MHLVLGLAVTAVFAVVAVLGAWHWYRFQPSRLFWSLLRAGQVLLVLEVLAGGLLLLIGRNVGDDLHLLYGILPLVVSFVAEQLRITSAETVLEARGLADAQAVGRLPAEQQRSVVVAIVRRELGVMTLAAVFILGLLLRAAFASGGLG